MWAKWEACKVRCDASQTKVCLTTIKSDCILNNPNNIHKYFSDSSKAYFRPFYVYGNTEPDTVDGNTEPDTMVQNTKNITVQATVVPDSVDPTNMMDNTKNIGVEAASDVGPTNMVGSYSIINTPTEPDRKM